MSPLSKSAANLRRCARLLNGIGQISSPRRRIFQPKTALVSEGIQKCDSYVLAETAHLSHLDEAKCFVRRCADVIREVGVGREFGTAHRTAPIFRRLDKRSPDTSASRFRNHVPTLDVGNSVAGATLGIGANRQLDESEGAALSIFGDEYGERLE